MCASSSFIVIEFMSGQSVLRLPSEVHQEVPVARAKPLDATFVHVRHIHLDDEATSH